MSFALVPVEKAEQIFRQNHKVRTIEDLWAIPVDPPRRLIRIIDDPYVSTWNVDQLNWTKAWNLYSYARAVEAARSKWPPKFENWFDSLRFKAHLKLIQWKVII